MSTIVIRVDLDPETAKAVRRAATLVRQKVQADLADSPPEHTKRALDEQDEALAGAIRALDLALANPRAVPLPAKEDAS